MAKKRVHELAKQYDMPSAEVMTKLNAYGLNVKASASAVDEHEAERALTGKPPKKESNGKPDAPKAAPQQTGMGFDKPASETAQQRLDERQQRLQEAQKRQGRRRQASEPPAGRRAATAARAPAPDPLLAPGRARPRRRPAACAAS